MQRFKIEKSKTFIKDLNSLRDKPSVFTNVQDAIRKLENGEKLHQENFIGHICNVSLKRSPVLVLLSSIFYIELHLGS